MGKRRVLFYYYGPHSFHAALAKSIGAVPMRAPHANSQLSRAIKLVYHAVSIPKDYSVYFCEATYVVPALSKRLRMLDGKIVDIIADPLLYYLKIGRMKGAVGKLYYDGLKKVDLFITPSKMADKWLSDLVPGAKSLLVYTCPPQKSRNDLLKMRNIEPELDEHKILLIAGGPDDYHKGLDLLSKAFVEVKKEWPDAELNIVGGRWSKEIIDKYTKYSNSIHFLGYVDNIYKLIKSSSVYVHLGRGDMFPASSIEAMLGGLPSIVSDVTGTKEIVEKVDKRLVVPLSAKEAAKRIDWYFRLPYSKKAEISKNLIELAAEYDEGKAVRAFKKDFEKAISD